MYEKKKKKEINSKLFIFQTIDLLVVWHNSACALTKNPRIRPPDIFFFFFFITILVLGRARRKSNGMNKKHQKSRREKIDYEVIGNLLHVVSACAHCKAIIVVQRTDKEAWLIYLCE